MQDLKDYLRFCSYVKKSNGCWIWTGPKFSDGYGSCRINGKNKLAHRVCFEIYHGGIPDGLFICHRCDVKSCVNPHHLFAGTNQMNMLDASKKGLLAFGKRNGMQNSPTLKLNEQKVRHIRKDYCRGIITHKMLGEKYGVTKRTVRAIIAGEIWNWVK